MHISQKTIEYAIPQLESVQGDSVVATGSLTVFVPESVSRTFVSVVAETTCLQHRTAAVSPTGVTVALGIGAVGDTTVTITDTITNSGEQTGFCFITNFTQYFNVNFTDKSHPVDMSFRLVGDSVSNVAHKLYITYNYGDTIGDTRVKTVRIPIESNTGALTTSLVELGTNQVPLLNTFCPEADKSFKDIFFEIWVNETTTAASAPNPVLQLSLDAEAGDSDGPHEDILVSARCYRRLWKRNDMTTSATHAFKASTHNIQMPFRMLGAVLTVTYTYSESSTTQVLNSLLMGVGDEPGFPGNTTSADQSAFIKKFYIEEPGKTGGDTITLVQSGLLVRFIDSAAVTLSVGAGGQTARAYSNVATVVAGDFPLIHRIDSGGAAGAGISIARGENSITSKWFAGSAVAGSTGSFVSIMAILNYVSGKSSQNGGTARHAHSVINLMKAYGADAFFNTFTFAFSIPETEYRVVSANAIIDSFRAGTAQTPEYFCFSCERGAGEGAGSGWEDLYTGTMALDAEMAFTRTYARMTSSFKRWPTNPDSSLLNFKTSRTWRIYSSAVRYYCMMSVLTYCSINYSIQGVLSGYGSSPVGDSVKFYRADTGEFLGGDTVLTGDSYNFVWYDNVHPVFAEYYGDTTHVGRSISSIATGTP